MFFILSKVLTFLIQPLFWVYALVILAFVLRKGKYKKKLLITAGVVFWFFTNTFIVDEFTRAWEIRPEKDQNFRTYPVAVVLGGMSAWDAKNERLRFHESNDRLMQTLRLYKIGKVKKVLVSGGSGSIEFPENREASYIKKYLGEIQLLDSNFYFEIDSRNTHENAAYSKVILDKISNGDTVLLVTSAFHMKRASACFNAAGIPHRVYSTDNSTGERRFSLELMLIPTIEAMGKWNMLLKEWIGTATYKLRGWA